MAGMNLDSEEDKKLEVKDVIDENETVEYINYWLEVEKKLSDVLNNLKGLVLIIHNGLEFTDIVEFLNKVEPNRFMNVLYISLVRSYNYMKQVMEFKPCKSKRFFVVDCVSGYAFPIESNVDECFYHKPPSSLEEMKDIVRFGVEKSKSDMILLDSLSQFINFSHPTRDELGELYSFLRMLKDEASTNGQDSVILLYDSGVSEPHHFPKDVFDEIIKIEKIRKVNKEPLMVNWFQQSGSFSQFFDYNLRID